jgi:uncharacterized membrane protein
MPQKKTYTNIYGRRAGRGARPYLIMLKLLFVSTFLGSLISFRMLWFLQSSPSSSRQWTRLIEQTHHFFTYLVIPSAIGAIIIGLILLASLGRVMLKMRWFQVKMVLLIIGVPCLHGVMRSRITSLQNAIVNSAPAPTAESLANQLGLGAMAAIGFALILIWLGRVKPRLAQDYGRAYQKKWW